MQKILSAIAPEPRFVLCLVLIASVSSSENDWLGPPTCWKPWPGTFFLRFPGSESLDRYQTAR